jgi:transketolase
VVEDHVPEGGLADAVSEVFAGRPAPAIVRLAVRDMPHSGTPEELLEDAGISARHIADAVRSAVPAGVPAPGPAPGA